jgi:hypothetical protein
LAWQNKRASVQSQKLSNKAENLSPDNWGIWVKCLEDTAKVAYPTKLQYNPDALPKK